jgi:hypothetical protein
MSRFASRQLLLAGGGLAVLVAGAAGAFAQPASAPNFAANDAGWIAMGGDIAPLPGSPPLLRQDPAHPFVGNNTGAQPTYRIADLNNPNIKQWAKDIMKKDNDEVIAGKIAYTARQSCKPAGVPNFMQFGVRPVFFLQRPKEITIIYSGDAQVRHVYLDVPHSANPKSSWYGESVGHYEGDTLVVDTIGLNDKTVVDSYRTPHTQKLHVTERWRLANNGENLEVSMKVEDPDTYNEPWSGVLRYRHVQQQMTEEVCAEGNFLLFDYGVPVAKTPDF